MSSGSALPRALIVDDSLTVRMDLSAALDDAGFEVVLVSTGAEAREAFLHAQAFDLIILDVILPDDDGIEILKMIRGSASAARAQTPVMLLSSESEVRDRIRGLSTGADDYVGKPYELIYVVARARELVRNSAAAASTRENGHHITTPTVLVIDDSPTFRDEAFRREVERGGYQVLFASSGEEGLRLAASARPNAILVDGKLRGNGMDGAAFVRRVRLDSALRRTPCVLITSDEGADVEINALEAGADAILKKGDDTTIVLARLAAVLRSSAQKIEARDEPSSALGPKKILIVDDSPTYLNEVSNVLRTDGYDVVCAHSGEEALELLAIERIDCILLDLMMPGLSGEETCQRIKSANVVRDTPLIMVTSAEDREAMIKGLGAGADDFISKSSDFQVLRARVIAQIRRKQFEDENRRIREELLRKEMDVAEARAQRALAETRATLLAELERKNKELETFSYSVSHDLRAPLRSIDGFSEVLLEDYGEKLDDTGREHLRRVRKAAKRMSELIDDLLELSRIGRGELKRAPIDLSAVARDVFEAARRKDDVNGAETTNNEVTFADVGEVLVDADPRLLRVLLENLIGNAIKFTSKTKEARVEIGKTEKDGVPAYYVRDNGAGFDMSHAQKLFAPFQRLHREAEFPGTGIGLATVYRIADRHGGRVWAEGEVGRGATIYFTLSGGSSQPQPQA